ncbi:MAG TPA: class I SAM-dependent methyltransferase [Dehalococcoidia bacterium]|nr:class I SAM-dependent methyltransferase [Dehalococcoidia bacterium]
MDTNLIERLTDGIFSKALQVRRMIQRGVTDVMHLPLAEIVALGDRVEALLTPDQLTEGAEAVARQRWHKPTVEMGVREGYAEWSKQYDGEAKANPLIALEEPVVLELLGDVSDLDVLDAACGTGRYALRLAEDGARVCGVDATEEMLAHGRRKAADQDLTVDLRHGNLDALPFEDGSFDLVLSALALCHIPDLGPAMAEFARVVRPGGRLLISDFHPFCLLIGWRTCFDRPEARYWIENHLNLTEGYVRALLANDFELTDLRESVVDERAAGILSEHDIERFRGWPAALVVEARRERTP